MRDYSASKTALRLLTVLASVVLFISVFLNWIKVSTSYFSVDMATAIDLLSEAEDVVKFAGLEGGESASVFAMISVAGVLCVMVCSIILLVFACIGRERAYYGCPVAVLLVSLYFFGEFGEHLKPGIGFWLAWLSSISASVTHKMFVSCCEKQNEEKAALKSRQRREKAEEDRERKNMLAAKAAELAKKREEEPIFCGACGKRLPAKAIYCAKCGQKLK